jgi:large subunit ribosomal protein L25
MEIPTIAAQRRAKIGSRHSRRIRDEGFLPGVIYGHGQAPEAFQFSAHEFRIHLGHGARLLKVNLDGKPGDYLIKEVQYDHLQKDPVHIDLARVNLDEKVTVTVGIDLRGTPKGIAEGGILDLVIGQVEVECVASNIPDTLHPNVKDLGVGDSLTAGELALPDGVTLLSDPEAVIAVVNLLSTKEVEEVEAGEEGDAAEPERIGGRPDESKEDSDD